MNEDDPPPEVHPVLLYLDSLQARMAPEDFTLLMRMLQPVMAAVLERRYGTVTVDLGEDEARVTPALREEVATVMSIAVTGRMDHGLVQLGADADGHPIHVMVDADTAADPHKLNDIRDWAAERRRQDQELRGIAEVSDIDDET